MSDIDTLLKQSVGELEKLLKAQNVIGEPSTHGSVTVIPLVMPTSVVLVDRI